MTTEILDTPTVRAALEAFRGGEWGADCVQYKNSINDDRCIVYDFMWNPVSVRAPELLHYLDKGFVAGEASAAVNSEELLEYVEADWVTGAVPIIITLTNGVWVDGDDFDDARQDIIDGLDGSVAAGTGFDEKVRALLDVDDVVRTSDTVVTITTDPAPEYAITADETVTVTVPAEVVLHPTSGEPYAEAIAAGTFTITNETL